jgi:hypothetical protein
MNFQLMMVGFGLILVTMSLFSVISMIAGGAAAKRNALMFGVAANLGGLKTFGGELSFPKVGFLRRLVNQVVIHDFYKGRELDVRSSGSRAPVMQIELRLERLAKFSIKLRTRDFVTKLFFLAKEFKSGDPEFDALFFQSGNAPKLAGRILLPELRARIAEVWKRENCVGFITIENSRVRYWEPGNMKSEDDARRMETLVQLMSDIADSADAVLEMAGAPLRKKKVEEGTAT